MIKHVILIVNQNYQHLVVQLLLNTSHEFFQQQIKTQLLMQYVEKFDIVEFGNQ